MEIGAQGYLGEGNYPAISSKDLYNAAMSISPVEYPKMFFINGEAVSYTHLDVYKRQALCRCSRHSVQDSFGEVQGDFLK